MFKKKTHEEEPETLDAPVETPAEAPKEPDAATAERERILALAQDMADKNQSALETIALEAFIAKVKAGG